MLGQEFCDAVRTMPLWIFAVIPLKKLDFVVKRLFLVVDSDFDLDVLFSGSPGDGYSDVAHSCGD